jgi:hypothetical protein
MIRTLKSVTDDRVRAYVVWLPIFGGNFRGESRKLSRSFPDRRVSYFIDPRSRTGSVWEPVLKTERLAWDVYLLYDGAAIWEETPPVPGFWMHQLHGVTNAPRLDEAQFTAKLKSMLAELKSPQVSGPTR